MKKNRFISFTLAALLCVSCGSAVDSPVVTTEGQDDTTTEAVEPNPLDKLGKHDFGGKKYTILTVNNGYGSQPNFDFEFTADEPNGEILNDAAYNRRVKIEDMYNVKIDVVGMPVADQIETIKSCVLSGDDTYSLVNSGVNKANGNALNGIYANFHDFEDIDLYQPWWNQQATESLTINGKCYVQTNYINASGVLATHCLFYNQRLADENKTEDLYKLVFEGKWTIDKMLEITESVTRDLNGDTVYDENDMYGFMASYGTIGIMHYGLHNPMVDVNENGKVEINLMTDRMQTTVDKVFALAFENNRSWVRPISEENALAALFSNGQALFYAGFFFDMFSTFRDMKDDFALLPYPKFDEAQEGYYTTIQGAAPVISIPAIVSDEKMVGVVTEALAIEGYNSIRPALIDMTLSNKLMRDEKSVEVLNMYFRGIDVQLAMVHKNTSVVFECIRQLLENKSTDLASYVASKIPNATESYQKIVDGFYKD